MHYNTAVITVTVFPKRETDHSKVNVKLPLSLNKHYVMVYPVLN
jgi:hypothetical protein